MMIRTLVLTIALFLLFPIAVQARNTEHLLSIREALGSELAKQRLTEDVRLYFGGQRAPAERKRLGERITRKATRGLFRSDEAACQVAFISGLIQLQQRALKEGANAVVQIASTSGPGPLSSKSEYRCLAGAFVVRVGLKGVLIQTR